MRCLTSEVTWTTHVDARLVLSSCTALEAVLRTIVAAVGIEQHAEANLHIGVEVATGVLHNVGNTLNSVNISTSLVIDRLRKSRVTSLARVASLLRNHLTDLPTFLARDEQGQKLPPYLIALSDQLQEERASPVAKRGRGGDSGVWLREASLVRRREKASAIGVAPA